jgi:hypothetical protein
MHSDRVFLYKQLEEKRNSKVVAYVTGDKRNMETQIHAETLDFFTHHLDIIGSTTKISLFLYSPGGNTLAAWSITNLFRQFCKELEIIVPAKAHSAATLMCLGADAIVMTKQASLGPIDPSVNSPLNPGVPGAPPQTRFPVSVEAINGYIQLAKNEFEIKEPSELCQVLIKLSEMVHPVVLGNTNRARSQIKMLAEKLLMRRKKKSGDVQKAIDFLCSESGSHDYTINRVEAREDLGLNVVSPTPEEYEIIKNIYLDIRQELDLNSPYNPYALIGTENSVDYTIKRCIIESVSGGEHAFQSEGTLTKHMVQVQPGITQPGVGDQRTFEGWKSYEG